MKYQIYLNKFTSEIVNKMAEEINIKPATMIKEIFETNVLNGYKQAQEFKAMAEDIKGGN